MTYTSEFMVFRKFKYLSLLNLLRLQAELCTLEDTLTILQEEDAGRAKNGWDHTALNFQFVRETEDSQQVALITQIAALLHAYCMSYTSTISRANGVTRYCTRRA